MNMSIYLDKIIMLSLILKLELIIHLNIKKGLKNLKFKTFLIKLFYFFFI